MKIKGFLVLLILTAVVVYFLFIFKSGKQEQLPGQIEAFQSMKEKLTKTNMATLERVITSYIANEGRAPETLDDLENYYLLPSARVDAWRTAIKYERISDSRFRLISAGRDRLFKTEDDIIIED
jgi:Ca2+/Na+ antiporter